MSARNVSRPDMTSRLSFWLLSVFLVILWVAGGASRADVSGQSVVRFFAWTFLIVYILFAGRFDWRRIKPVVIIFGLAVILVGAQLIPLPPSIWTALPGRELLMLAAEVSGQPQPWRPLSISPSATTNAFGSLVVPALTLVLSAQLNSEQQRRIAAVILGLVFAGCLLALLQFSGASFHNPLINYQVGAVSGNFANRNHFALFLALGCILAPIWGFVGVRQARWRGILAIALLPLFLLVIFATGSRTGILLAVLAIAAGLFLVRAPASTMFESLPRWQSASLLASAILGVCSVVVLSVGLGRAVAIDRALDLEASADMRSQALPYLLELLGRYFPIGSGFGTFDPMYRIGEPDSLLRTAYFNHAHNDWLEIVLDGGLAGAALLIGSLGWIAVSSVRVLRRRPPGEGMARTGALALLIISLASLLDYPARTPMIMAIIVVASIWLHLGLRASPDENERPSGAA